jgi:hypothetical protein
VALRLVCLGVVQGGWAGPCHPALYLQGDWHRAGALSFKPGRHHGSWQKSHFFLIGDSVVLGFPAPSNLLRTELTALNYLNVWGEDLESTRAHAVAF